MALSHVDRKIRRENIAKYANKHGGKAAADKFSVSLCLVKKSCRENGFKSAVELSHIDRKIRRENIAKYANEYGDKATANKFKISLGLVESSRKENGIAAAQTLSKVPRSSYKIIAALIRGEQQASIALRFNITRQAVFHISKRMTIAGIYAAIKEK